MTPSTPRADPAQARPMRPRIDPRAWLLCAAGLTGMSGLAGLTNPAWALQIVDARDGETVVAKVSRQEVTRIAFERGRVRKVTGNAGEFLLEKDDARGDVFIRPTDPLSNKPINLFLSSDRHTVALLLQPVDLPSDTIVVREPQTGPRTTDPGSGAAMRSARHVRSLKNLLLALAGDHLPEDMQVRVADRPTPRFVPTWPGTQMLLQRQLIGESLVAEKHLLTHVGHGLQVLEEAALYERGVVAVAIEHRWLQPGEASAVFVIRERRGDE